jgi:gamma-glutamyltranspeptidase / glutathione hydrolase
VTSPTARDWMVATSHPLAVDAALEMMREGGNAVDAAVVAAAVLTVVDARSTGLGGDAFAMYWNSKLQRPEAMASGGPAPAGLTMEVLRDAGFDAMPDDGPWTVTVPGVVAGWHDVLERLGTVDLDRALGPAIDIAADGFEVSRTVATDWNDSVEKLSRHPYSASVYLVDGRAPKVGEHMTNPDLAGTLRSIASDGPKVFYEGWIAERIHRAVQEAGGVLDASDLSDWRGPRWVEPISSTFRGVEVYELPPPNQGLLALQALRIYEGIGSSSMLEEEHAAIESLKLAFADARTYIADPDLGPVPVTTLLSDAYVAERRALIGMSIAQAPEAGRTEDTVYVAVMKGDEGCSFIQSIYAGFGSGVGVEGTGIILQNRGSGFVLEEGHVNRPEPRKRPYHTILPAMLGRDGKPWGCIGHVGGFMQPQGRLQVLRNLLDRGDDPQAAVSRARWRVLGDRRVAFEPEFDGGIVDELRKMGHEPSELSSFEAGGGQMVLRTGEGFVGGSDPRKDGRADGD